MRNCFDFDQQLYDYYKIQQDLENIGHNLNFYVSFVGSNETERIEICGKLKILQKLVVLKDKSHKGAEILQKADTIIRFYMINKEGQIYNTADNADILKELLLFEFATEQQREMIQPSLNAHICISENYITYEGRIYKFLNKHSPINLMTTTHVSIFFTRLPPVSKIVNYDSFK